MVFAGPTNISISLNTRPADRADVRRQSDHVEPSPTLPPATPRSCCDATHI